MDRITLRLPHDLTRRFDAAAALEGGRSRFLRRLMERAAQVPLPEPARPQPGPPSTKITLRLAPHDMGLVETAASAAGVTRNQWCVRLIRRRVHGRPQFTPPESLCLIEVRRELRRIGVNVNQIARALNTAVMEGAVLDLELDQLADFRREIGTWIDALEEAFKGNLDYWRTDP
jgi:uncharacterized protein (DUF1778 family)